MTSELDHIAALLAEQTLEDKRRLRGYLDERIAEEEAEQEDED